MGKVMDTYFVLHVRRLTGEEHHIPPPFAPQSMPRAVGGAPADSEPLSTGWLSVIVGVT
jgi:hypothetical protein